MVPPHSGQVVKGSSVIFCQVSNRWLHVRHRYSYVGIQFLPLSYLFMPPTAAERGFRGHPAPRQRTLSSALLVHTLPTAAERGFRGHPRPHRGLCPLHPYFIRCSVKGV